MPGGIISSLKDFSEQKRVFQKISVWEATIWGNSACEEFGSTKTTKNNNFDERRKHGEHIDATVSNSTTIVTFKGASGPFRKGIYVFSINQLRKTARWYRKRTWRCKSLMECYR